MNWVILGPPGAGKGTQAAHLAARKGWIHLSTGDLLRQAAAAGSSLGKQASAYMEKGALVPDDVMVAIIRERLPKKGGFVLDGFPRTLGQAQALDEMLFKERQSLSGAINLTVSDEEIKRLSGRRQCSQGHVFHLRFNPSKKGESCDICGESLTQRSDDGPETVRKRLDVYRAQTEPVIGLFRGQGKLRTVSGEGTPDSISERLDREIEK